MSFRSGWVACVSAAVGLVVGTLLGAGVIPLSLHLPISLALGALAMGAGAIEERLRS